MSKILVTGSDGRFGKIIKKFNDKRFIFRNKKELNILSATSIKKNLKKFKPNYVLHLARLSRPMEVHEKNISNTFQMQLDNKYLGVVVGFLKRDFFLLEFTNPTSLLNCSQPIQMQM